MGWGGVHGVGERVWDWKITYKQNNIIEGKKSIIWLWGPFLGSMTHMSQIRTTKKCLKSYAKLSHSCIYNFAIPLKNVLFYFVIYAVWYLSEVFSCYNILAISSQNSCFRILITNLYNHSQLWWHSTAVQIVRIWKWNQNIWRKETFS